ncbi:hypothetical protein [Trichococcus flocculiformis]|uniref:hypothetical protein n=1 Tax=Trichococcus flocculiformis TaxID=82803 RepID=UPI003DA60CE7
MGDTSADEFEIPGETCLTKKNNVSGIATSADAGSTVTLGVFKVELTLLGNILLKISISFLP